MEFSIKDILEQAKAATENAPTKPRFRIRLSKEEMAEELTIAYQKEVEVREGKFLLDRHTQDHIGMVADWLTNEKKKPCILLYGSVGNGKSTMSLAVRRALSDISQSAQTILKEHRWQMSKEQQELVDAIVRTTPIPFLCTAVDIAQWAREAKERTSDKWMRLQQTSFIGIDDLGCEPTTIKNYGTDINPVTDLLYRRYDNRSPTIITTNLDRKDIRDKYGDRLADRFNEMFESIGHTTGSYRK